jgi:DNA-binding HxlR family transcriptional regulator
MNKLLTEPWLIADQMECPINKAVSTFRGKWKPNILYTLSFGPMYFLQITRVLNDASRKVVAEQLKELEADGLVTRTEIDGAVKRVKYSLSERGNALAPILQSLCEWSLADDQS